MFEVHGNAVVATVSDLRKNVKTTVEKAAKRPVYLVSDGRPVAMLVGVNLWEKILELLENARDIEVATRRIEQANQDPTEVLSSEDFWKSVEAGRTGGKKHSRA